MIIIAPMTLPQYIVIVAKNGCARAAYEDVATFQSKVVIGFNRPRPIDEPVIMAKVKFSGAIQVIQLKVDKAVKR